MMGRKRVAAVAAFSMLGLVAIAGPAGAEKEGIPGKSFCSGATGPDGVVDLEDVSTWNSPGEVVSYIAPDQEVGDGAVAAFCNPNANPLP